VVSRAWAAVRTRARVLLGSVADRPRGRQLPSAPSPRIPSQAIPIVVGMRVLAFIRRVISWLPGRLASPACAPSAGVSSRARVLNPCHPLTTKSAKQVGRSTRPTRDTLRAEGLNHSYGRTNVRVLRRVAGPLRTPSDPRPRIPSQASRIVSGMTFDLLSWIGGGVAVEDEL